MRSMLIAALTALGLICICHGATASQLLVSADCSFVVHVPGLLGGTDLKLTARKGALFTQDASDKFCGTVSQATPFGQSQLPQCFIVTDGKLVSGRYSNKVTSSDCVLTDAAAIQSPFLVDELAPWTSGAAASIHGQAFLKTVGGDVKTCAGAQVILLPATPYVGELLTKKRAGIVIEGDPRLASFTRMTICDAQGNFSFVGVPVARWYLMTSVTWGVPRIGEGGTDTEGGELTQILALMPGDNQALLTARDKQ